MTETFYWHDYETWGTDARRDRPCQFAGQRTDAELNPIGEPLVCFSRPANDLLPNPGACLITGITPQQALEQGLPEAEFARTIQAAFAEPGTCSVGYNSHRFDDEVTRNLFYRNLLDPYAHTYKNGNSRWDLIDVLRLAQALRPEGMEWPLNDEGHVSFRLERLSDANGIPHADAHDALGDVRVTIALAKRLKQAQPRLFAFALGLRRLNEVQALIDRDIPLIHASSRYPAALGCIAPVLVIAPTADNPKQVICADLRQDPEVLLDLDAETLAERLFTPGDALPESVERPGLKQIKLNASPMLAPLPTLSPAAAERWSIDLDQVQANAVRLRAARVALTPKLQQVFASRHFPRDEDPDLMLYSGFIPNADRDQMERLRGLDPAALADANPRFQDGRLPTLLFRMRARSWPQTLSEDEREDWDAWRFERLTDPTAGGSLTIDAYQQALDSLRTDAGLTPAQQQILEALDAWGEAIMDTTE